MAREVRNSAGVNVTRQVCLDRDAVFHEKIDEGGIFKGAGAVANSFGAKEFDRIPDTLRSAGFARVNGDPPAGVAALGKMFDKKRRGEIRFVTGQIERDEMLAIREKRIEFLHGYVGAVSPAENSDQVHAQPGRRHPFRDPLHDAFNHFTRVECMRLGHEPRTKPQLEIINSLPFRVLDIFPGDPAAGIAVGQHPRQP
jgi:hypothetical protein